MSLVSLKAVCIVLCLSAVFSRLPVSYRPFALIVSGLLFFADSPDLLLLHSAHILLTLISALLMVWYEKAGKPLLILGISVQCVSLFWLHGRGGFSFAALAHIGFLLDIARTRELRGIAASASVLAYFPWLQEGPIIDVLAVSDQLSHVESPSWARASRAVLRIVTGLVKKLVIADRFAPFVNSVFSSPQVCGAGALWLAVLAYAVQVYMDFSGCMDIVLGASSLVGIDLPENFRRPYLADSFSEYWRRWHITMGSWFKRRFFYPLVTSVPMLKLAGRLTGRSGGLSGAGMAMAVPLLLTWALVGLWHGPAPHYVLWGIVNGLLILSERLFPAKRLRLPKALRIAKTFLLMSLTRVLFRADSLRSALRFYAGLFRFTGGAFSPKSASPALFVAVFAALLFFLNEIHTEQVGAREIPVCRALVLAALGAAAVLIFGCYGPGYSPTEFYYNRF